MEYQSLYRRYRPQRFEEVLGQDHVTTALRNAVRTGKVTHAYLFSGPRGTGKTSSARILAKALNCTDLQGGEPCGLLFQCGGVGIADRQADKARGHGDQREDNEQLDEGETAVPSSVHVKTVSRGAWRPSA